MIKYESALDLFQRIQIKDVSDYSCLIDRLNRYSHLLFPDDSHNQGHLAELLDQHRTTTKKFLHGFISDYIEYWNHREALLKMSLQSNAFLSHSPQANKNSSGSNIPKLQPNMSYDESLMFLYIDTEYKACPFHSDRVQW
jgi:hypothetical protein